MWSGKLGFRKIDRHLISDVNLGAIPILEPGFEVIAADRLSFGGDAPKSVINYPAPGRVYAHAYIAKGSRKHGPRECVTESLISAVAANLPLQIAQSRLAIVPGGTGRRAPRDRS